MNSQKGAALIVVLSMLTASLMLGLTSMQSSMIDERLAGNYKAAAQAQMRAENAAAEAVANSLSWGGGAPEFDDLEAAKKARWSIYQGVGFKEDSDNISICGGDSCFYLPVKVGGDDWVMAQGAVFDSDGGLVAESEPILVEVNSSFFGFDPEATVSCLGTGCSFTPGSGKSGPVIDGTDRRAEGKTNGSNRPDPAYDENGDEVFVPAVLMADMGSSPFDSLGGGIIGLQIYTQDDYEGFKESEDAEGYVQDEDGWMAVKAVIQKEIDDAVNTAPNSSGVFYAGEGEVVSPGSNSGVVVINGGTLSLGGSDKFTGLVIMRGGYIESQGTPAIVGAIIGNDYSFVGGGNPTVLYSSEAIGNAQNLGGSGGGAVQEIISWK